MTAPMRNAVTELKEKSKTMDASYSSLCRKLLKGIDKLDWPEGNQGYAAQLDRPFNRR